MSGGLLELLPSGRLNPAIRVVWGRVKASSKAHLHSINLPSLGNIQSAEIGSEYNRIAAASQAYKAAYHALVTPAIP